MAIAARRIFSADVAVSITGTAEVNPADPVYAKPAIWFAVATEDKCISREYYFPLERESNIQRAVAIAMHLCMKMMGGNN